MTDKITKSSIPRVATLAAAMLAVSHAEGADGGSVTNDAGEATALTHFNLLSNGDFEEGVMAAPVSWRLVNVHEDVTGNWIDGEGVEGSRCVEIEAGTPLSYGWWESSYEIILEPGRSYTFGGLHKGADVSVLISGEAVEYNPEDATAKRYLNKSMNQKCIVDLSEEWAPFEKVFSTPPNALSYWVKMKLMIVGTWGRDEKKKAFFDNLYLVTDTLKLAEPLVPQTLKPSQLMELQVAACDHKGKARTDIAEWKVHCGEEPLAVLSAVPTLDSSLWNLRIQVPERAGVYDLKLEALLENRKKKPLDLLKSAFIQVNEGSSQMFSFTLFADPHIKDDDVESPRNRQFSHILSTINGLNPLLTLGVGDLTGISNGDDDVKMKRKFDGYMDLVSTLKGPLYHVAGNHEYDRDINGVQTRWHYTHYMGAPLYYSFDIENFHFVGLDSNTVGIYSNEHLGSFHLKSQKEWFEEDIAAASKAGKVIVVMFHEPLHEGGQFLQDEQWEAYLDLIYKHKVKLVFEGHNHHNWIVTKRNPYVQGAGDLEEVSVNPDEELVNLGILSYYRDPQFTIFEQTTTASAFLMRGSKYFGFRYLVVKDGQVIFDDSIPESFSIENSVDSGTGLPTITVVNGSEKSFTNMPFKIDVAPGNYQVKVDDKIVESDSIINGDRVDLWIYLDLQKGGESIIDVAESF